MADREKLIELLEKSHDELDKLCEHDCSICKYDVQGFGCIDVRLAEYLISHGCRLERKQSIGNNASDESKRWIPVTERLPAHGETVQWIKRIDKSQMIAKYDQRRNVWTDGHYYGGMNGVTHWMPLPEPPKGE